MWYSSERERYFRVKNLFFLVSCDLFNKLCYYIDVCLCNLSQDHLLVCLLWCSGHLHWGHHLVHHQECCLLDHHRVVLLVCPQVLHQGCPPLWGLCYLGYPQVQVRIFLFVKCWSFLNNQLISCKSYCIVTLFTIIKVIHTKMKYFCFVLSSKNNLNKCDSWW